MLSNIQIEDIARRMSLDLVGCFNKDELPSRFEVGRSYIINIEDSQDEEGKELPGSHWTAFMMVEHTDHPIPMYFDSFGIGPPRQVEERVKRQLGKKRSKICFSHKQVQDQEVSAMCGWFCLAWLSFMKKRGDGRFFSNDMVVRYGDFLDIFEERDLVQNDERLKLFFMPRPGTAEADAFIAERAAAAAASSAGDAGDVVPPAVDA